MDTQVYVGAFRNLANKQHKYDKRRNQDNAKSVELKQLMNLAKTLLCEIETAINDSTTLTMPNVYTRQQMEQKLLVRSDEHEHARSMHDEEDDLGNKFAKVRFHEYMRSLDRIMKLPRKKRSNLPCKSRKYKRRNLCGKRDADCKGANCASIEPPTETQNKEIANRHSQHRLHHRLRTGHGGHVGGGFASSARLNQIIDENPNRLQRPHRRHRQNRHRNQLHYQIGDGKAANGLSAPLHRNRRQKILRAIDVSSTTTTPTFSPFNAL